MQGMLGHQRIPVVTSALALSPQRPGSMYCQSSGGRRAAVPCDCGVFLGKPDLVLPR